MKSNAKYHFLFIRSCLNKILISIFIISPYFLLAQSVKRGFSPTNKLTELNIKHWTTENGLPSNTINSIFQSSDGFIWLSTYETFMKFDGINFIPIGEKDKVPGGFTIHQNSKNEIWLQTISNGIKIFKNNNLTDGYQIVSGIPKSVISVFEDSKETIWVGSINYGLYTLVNNFLKKVDYEPVNDVTIHEIREAKNGTIWIVTEGNGVTFLQGGKFKTLTKENGLNDNLVSSVLPDKEGNVWLGTMSGLNRYKDGEIISFPELDKVSVRKIIEDDYGNIWFATDQGIFRKNAQSGEFEQLSEELGLPNRELTNLLFDSEGNLWASSSRNGLFRLKPTSFLTLGQKSGKKPGKMNVISEISADNFLIGNDNGQVFKCVNDEVTLLDLKSNIANQRIRSILKDSKGTTWIATYAGILRLTQEGEQLITMDEGLPTNQIRLLYEDRKKKIWVGTRNFGIIKLDHNGTVLDTLNKANGLSSNFIMSIDESINNDLLVGTADGGLSIVDNEGNVSSLLIEDGLPGNVVFNTYVDNKGAIWICTDNGLARFHKGNVSGLFKNESFLPDSPFDYIEDDYGNVWIATTNGVIQVSKSDIENLIEGRIFEIEKRVFGRDDGMIAKECIGASKIIKSSNGNIWFPTVKGVSYIDPSNILKNGLVPPVQILTFKVDDAAIPISDEIILSSETQRYVFEFTALSLVAPTKVNFKYMLEGFDKEWITPKYNERHASYTNLEFGDYTFKLQASNNDGIWNEEGVEISFYLEPKFYETKTFYFFTTIIFLGLLIGGFYWRTSFIKHKSRILQKIVDERTIEIQDQKKEIQDQHEHLKDTYKNVKILSDIGKLITSCLSVESIIETTFDSIHDLMPANIFAIGIYNEEAKRIEFPGKENHNPNQRKTYDSLIDDETLSLWCFKKNKEILVNDFINERQSDVVETYKNKSKINAMIYVPLYTKKKKIGVVTVQSYKTNCYKSFHSDLLKNLAVYVGIALENADVYEKIQSQKKLIESKSSKLENANDEIIKRNKEIENAHALIQNKNKELSDTNNLLEDKVFKRTYELRKALKELDMFIYRTAHDLNGPVSRLIGLCNLISIEQDREMVLEYVNRLSSNSYDMKSLLSRLMRTQNLKYKELDVKKIDFEDTFNRIFQSYESYPQFERINFSISLKNDIQFYSDQSLINFLFENLIDNSVNFFDKNKEENYISIEVFQGMDKECRITIKDNGIGISKEVSGRIYEMFYRGTENSNGFGLGLYEVKLIIKKLTAKFWYKRTNKKETEFLIYLPCEKMDVPELEVSEIKA